jgi:uncharacterized protein (DUF2132 family)
MAEQKNNPLHGVNLETILHRLVEHFGWTILGKLIQINCFIENPSIQSSLKFLRKTPWARKKVEDLYLEIHNYEEEKPAEKPV